MWQKTILSAFLALSVLLILGLAQAPNPPAQAPTPPAATPAPAPAPVVIGPAKLAWMNLEQAILGCDEGKRELGEIQKFVDRKNSELEAMGKELETLKNQLSVQGAKLTDEARADLEDQIEAKDTNLQRFKQDTQKEIDARRVRTTNMIGKKMIPIIEKLAKEKGVSAVLYYLPNRDAWVDPALAVTDEVIKAYNAAYPVAPAKATAPVKKP